MKPLTIKKFLIPLLLLTFGVIFALGAQPDWWTDYSLVDGSTRQDDSVATIGQAKHAVQKAYQYLDTKLEPVGGVGEELTTLYNNYCVTAPADANNDRLPLTIGQLKYLAKPFYQRLNNAFVAFYTSEMNPASTDIYPWTVDQSDDNDLALATLGQLKFVFSFDLSGWAPPADGADFDEDGMSDIWEQQIVDADPDDIIISITNILPDEDFDADGLSNSNEFTGEADPLVRDHPALKLQFY